MRTVEDILALYQVRQRTQAGLRADQEEIRRIYNGQVTINLPDADAAAGSSIPNLLAMGVDQLAARAGSTVPVQSFAPENPKNRDSVRAATTARRTLDGWWQSERLPLKMNVRYRHLFAYGMSPTVVCFDRKSHRPYRQVRSPLETLPSPETINGTTRPEDVLFSYRRSVGWLRANGYGDAVTAITDDRQTHPDTAMTLVEYVDGDGQALLLTGYSGQTNGQDLPPAWAPAGSARAIALEFYPNRTGEMPATVPLRITLDGPMGQFDSMIGMYYQESMLMALEVIAVQKGIFPDQNLISRPGEQAKFIDGPHDGRTGLIGVITGGELQTQQYAPGYMTPQTMDRLERNQRVTAGIPAEFGGESSSNVRTGRRGDAVLTATIDFPMSEAQDVMCAALEDENRVGIAFAKTYDGSAPRTIYVGTGNAMRPVTYVANKVFTHSEHSVAYPVSGTDQNALMIGIGQRIGMGIMSKRTGAELDSYIADAELEHDRIQVEGMEEALVAQIEQKINSGELPLIAAAKIMSLVANDEMELAEAMIKVAEDAAKAQAAAPPPPGTPPTADAMAAPGAAGGLAGAPAAASVPGASPDQTSIAGLFSALRGPVKTVQPLRGAAQGAV